MKYVAQALWHEADISSFAPDKKIKAHVKYFPLLHFLLSLWETRSKKDYRFYIKKIQDQLLKAQVKSK